MPVSRHITTLLFHDCGVFKHYVPLDSDVGAAGLEFAGSPSLPPQGEGAGVPVNRPISSKGRDPPICGGAV